MVSGSFPVMSLALVLLASPETVLKGTDPLELTEDPASQMIGGIDRFLLEKLDGIREVREGNWTEALSAAKSTDDLWEAQRQRLSKMLGVRDPRSSPPCLELVTTLERSSIRGQSDEVIVHAVRWPAFGNVHGEGLLVTPSRGEIAARVVVVPDADQFPEQCVGLLSLEDASFPFPLALAEAGCQVLMPTLLSRDIEARNGRAKMTHREYIYRAAYELGRHVIGYELGKILACVDLFEKENAASSKDLPVGIAGWGEGGLLALSAAAVDPRIDVALVSGFFGEIEDLWQEPMDRNVFGLLNWFGAAEMALLVAPRRLLVEASEGPQFTMPPGLGGAPGRLSTPAWQGVQREWQRLLELTDRVFPDKRENLSLFHSVQGQGYASFEARVAFMRELIPSFSANEEEFPPSPLTPTQERRVTEKEIQSRLRRQLEELDRHNQWILSESPSVRRAFFEKVDLSSLERFQQTIEPYREIFRQDVIGEFEEELSDPKPRSRRIFDMETVTGYEVILDVFPHVMAYGILLLPKGIEQGRRRPAVVCQHGLEGRPQDLAHPDVSNSSYNQYGLRLAEEGFIVFAPQNPYILGDRFRTLQRKANPLGKTLFSIIVSQHQQIVNWLGSLDQVDSKRIAFYGLSYGGKTAMRVPALVSDYCLSICSGDFNDWVWKNASTRSPYSYMWTGEYEIFEFDLGSTFNYAEMAALICPRPFMVERGHFDGVAPDERVAYEFAKVRHLYNGKLGIGDLCAIEWFPGPHAIHGEGTFAFLKKHLGWPG